MILSNNSHKQYDPKQCLPLAGASHRQRGKSLRQKTALLLSSVALSITLFGAQQSQAQGFNATAAFTQSEEIKIRDELLQQVTRRGGTINDPVLSVYLDDLGDELAGNGPDNMPYRYFWLEDYTINAMAMPGGVIGINSGLFLATNNESELAGVLAHELGHVQGRHIARRFERQAQVARGQSALLIATAALAALTGAPGQALAAGALGSQAQGVIDQTRGFEREADTAAIRTLQANGYDVSGFGTFMMRLNQRNFGGGQVPAFLRTHPMPLDRAADLASQGGSGKLSSQEYELAKIRAMGLTNLRCHEQINTSGYRYSLSSEYAQYWRNRCATGSARGAERMATSHWIPAADHAQYLQETGQGAALQAFVRDAFARWPRNEAIMTYYLKAADAQGWTLNQLDAQTMGVLDNGLIQLPEIYRNYANVAARSGDTARSKAAYGFQALNSGRAFDAINNFRQAMQYAGNIGSAKTSWILAIKDINESYGF